MRRIGHLAAGLLLCVQAFAADSNTVTEKAKTFDRPAGAPRASDVSTRVLNTKKTRLDDRGHDVWWAASAFHVTRLDWVYVTDFKTGNVDADFIRKAHDRGLSIQGTINKRAFDPAHASKRIDHYKQLVADPTNKAYQNWYVQRLADMIRAGVDSIQRDDPTYVQLRLPPQQVVKFFETVHPPAFKNAGKKILISGNNIARWDDPTNLQFDFAMTDMPGHHKFGYTPGDYYRATSTGREKGRLQVFTAFSSGAKNRGAYVADCRRAFATSYACGAMQIVPWDKYLQDDLYGRFWIRPEEYADLTGFVRAMAPWLDGYEDAAVAGQRPQDGLTDTRWPAPPLAFEGGSGRLSAFVRAIPGKKEAPVVIHLVDWGGAPKPAKLRLTLSAFFPGEKISARLYTPVPYDARTHALAEAAAAKTLKPGGRRGPGEAAHYGKLAKETDLKVASTNRHATINIPALKPWGMLVVSRKP